MPGGRLIRDIVLTVLPKVAGGALTLLLSLVLVAVLPVEAYGAYSYAINLILLSDAILGTPFDLSVIRRAQSHARDDPALAVGVERQAIGLKAVCLVIMAAGAALLAYAVPGAIPLDPVLLGATIAAVVTLLLFRSVLLHLQMRERFHAYGALELTNVTAKMAPAFGLIALGLAAPLPIVGLLALGPALAMAAGLAGPARGLASPGDGVSHRGPLLRSLGWYFPTLALGATLARADLLILGAMVPAAALGIYGAAAVIASVPTMVGLYIGIVLTPRIVYRAEAGTLGPFYVRALLALGIAAIGAFGIFALLAGSAMADALPQRFRDIIPILAILLPGSLLGLLTTSVALPLVMLVRRDVLLKVDAVIAPIAIAGFIFFIDRSGIAGAAWVTLAVSLVRGAVVLWIGWRLTARPQDLSAAA